VGARRFYASQGFRQDDANKVDEASGVEEVRYIKLIRENLTGE